MTQHINLWVRRIYFALITLALIVVAILLMTQCVAIYRLGDTPFTRESVATHFAPIAVPVYVCIGLVAAGIVLSPILPAAPDSKPDRDNVTLRRLQDKLNDSYCSDEQYRLVSTQRRLRRVHLIVTLVLLAIGSAVFLWYATDLSRFTVEDINGSMIRAMLLLAPCMGVPAIYAVIAAYVTRRSVRKEIDLIHAALRDALTSQSNNGAQQNNKFKEKSFATRHKSDNEAWLPYLQGALLVIGVALVVVGLLENGAAAVLTKAINICTECIGLG